MRKRLCGLVLSIAATATATTGIGTAHAEETKRVFNGMQILFNKDYPDVFCTIGAVGNDDYGRKIAISAGHCITPGGGYDDREIPEDIAPIYDRNDVAAGVIGHVRYFKNPDGSQTGHVTKDYMVIELTPNTKLSSQGPYLKQTGELEVPGGTPSPNATTSPVLDKERLLGVAWNDSNHIVTSGQFGVFYGRVTDNKNGIYRAWTGHWRGDSGGPVIWHVPDTAFPSQENGFQAAGPWAGIVKGADLSIPPAIYTSSANILADLRARDAADPRDVYGAGFEVTANP
ncbi:hypothetical protein [Actinomadura macrotermitis]|uniref:Peptidase S1 domain-containing protein n=1 Tax=Actinomadura macrotermitis TaxID=2585200 RepID=A0A7K0BR78_9ACTN|nr:hypothetical protein [Actinomadura macrotermitis]MQY03651.1 hypothetical protein [Actinomadura macrotermitis]